MRERLAENAEEIAALPEPQPLPPPSVLWLLVIAAVALVIGFAIKLRA